MSSSVEIHAKQAVKILQKIPLTLWQKAVMLGLIVCLCLSIAQLFWILVGAFSSDPTELPANSASPVNVVLAERVSVVSRSVDIAKLSAINIFGKPDATAEQAVKPAVSAVVQNAPETKLKLVLKGILGSSDARHSKAIIAEGNKQALYSLGESLPGGRNVTLAKVMEDRVILENSGRFESLPLYTDAPPAPVNNSRTPVSRAQTHTVKSQALNKVSSGVTTLADVVKVSMVREGGKVVGYRVRPGRKRELFDSTGLKPNDIVTAVNGRNLDSSTVAMEVYKSMRAETSATFDVKRGEETLTLNIDTN